MKTYYKGYYIDKNYNVWLKNLHETKDFINKLNK